MCWSSKIKPVKLIAKEDIAVYKIVDKDKNGRYSSPCFVYEWNDKNAKKVDMNIISRIDGYCIFRGYHSYSLDCYFDYNLLTENGNSSISNSQDFYITIYSKAEKEDKIGRFHFYSCIGNYDLSIIKCIIPNGAEYYENEYGEIVSNELVFKEEITYNKINGKINLKI